MNLIIEKEIISGLYDTLGVSYSLQCKPRQLCSTYLGRSGRPARGVSWPPLVGPSSPSSYQPPMVSQGRDAKRLVMLRGEVESGEERGGRVKGDSAKK